MNIKHIKGNTYCIDTGNLYIPFYKINEGEIIMLDSGWREGERERLEKLLEDNNFRIAAIINSHSHRDHIGNNSYFKNKYNCIIAMPAYEALICSASGNLKPYFGNVTLKDVERQFGHLVCKTDILISTEQNEVVVRDILFKVFHTPGHSPAHICIITPDDVAYLGDNLITYDVMAESKLPFGYILSEDLKSKAKLRELNCSKYVLAHKGMYTDIEKLIEDNIEFYKGRAKAIYNVMDDTMTMEDIMRAVSKEFHIRLNSVERYAFIERMLKPYVEYLYEIDELRLEMRDGVSKYIKWKHQVFPL